MEREQIGRCLKYQNSLALIFRQTSVQIPNLEHRETRAESLRYFHTMLEHVISIYLRMQSTR